MTSIPSVELGPFEKQNLRIKPLCQGQTNGCGTTSMAMGLNYVKDGDTFTRECLDEGHRELNSFTSLQMMVNIAREHGAYAEMYNRMTFEEVAGHIKNQHPIITFLSTDPKGVDPRRWHYMLLQGFENNPDTSKRVIRYTDPASGQTFQALYDTYVNRLWSNFKGPWASFDSFGIVLSGKDDLPPSRDVPAGMNSMLMMANQALVQLGRLLKKAS